MAGVIGDSRFNLVPNSGCRKVSDNLQVSQIPVFHKQQAACANVTCLLNMERLDELVIAGLYTS